MGAGFPRKPARIDSAGSGARGRGFPHLEGFGLVLAGACNGNRGLYGYGSGAPEVPAEDAPKPAQEKRHRTPKGRLPSFAYGVVGRGFGPWVAEPSRSRLRTP